METSIMLGQLLTLVVDIFLIVAVLRIFAIDAKQKKMLKASENSELLLMKILKKLDAMDQNRREEFESLTAS